MNGKWYMLAALVFLSINSVILFGMSTSSSRPPPLSSKPIPTRPTFKRSKQNSNLQYVDPFIGTGGDGHTYPGATVPFGMVQVSPSSGDKRWGWCSGYHHSDTKVISYGHLHLSGTGIGDGFDISMFPKTKAGPSLQGDTYVHSNETASPGFYGVHLTSGIHVELTASNRTGVHRYTFPEGSSPTIQLHAGYGFDPVMQSSISIDSTSTASGFRRSDSWSKKHDVYFSVKFSCPYTSVSLISDSKPATKSAMGTNVEAHFTFSCTTIVAVVGLSSASVRGATASLSEVPTFNFDIAREHAQEMWAEQLSRVQVEGDEDSKVMFFSALYHTKLAPTLHSDLLGEFHGPAGVNRQVDFDFYSTFSIWDTFRACHALQTLLSPERIPDILKTLVTHYSYTGTLPIWTLFGQETNLMPGFHAVSLLAESILKGFDPGASLAEVYESMKRTASKIHSGLEKGYVPMSTHAVTKTLEFAYDDHCIAVIGGKLQAPDKDIYVNRSRWWRNVFDSETGFMRARNYDGSWHLPFDPLASSPESEYTEATAWQHIWFVPHAVPDFVAAFGGAKAFEKKLDDLFEHENSQLKGAMVDITGLIGQYAHGNEPSHHVAYLYNFVNRPDKTQRRVRQILKEMYSSRPDGLVGNEDCGQMSAWYVFSALGFYPMNPVSGEYQLGSPIFTRAVLDVGDSRTFEILAPQTNTQNVLVEKVLLNGKQLMRTFITHDEIVAGGVLEFQMKVAS